MFDLTERTALVTGATGGIGGAIAHTLHANGATVTISGTRIEMLDSLAGQLGGRVHVVRCNLTDEEDVENLVPAAEAAMGHVDILVNNAAITRTIFLCDSRTRTGIRFSPSISPLPFGSPAPPCAG